MLIETKKNILSVGFQALPLMPSVQTTEGPSGVPPHLKLMEPMTSGASAKWTLAGQRVGIIIIIIIFFVTL